MTNTILNRIYREIDGFYVFDPPQNIGVYTAHDLREIADRLDALNKPVAEQIEKALAELPAEEP